MKTITNLLLESKIGIEKIFYVAIIFKLLEDILWAFSRIQVWSNNFRNAIGFLQKSLKKKPL